MWTAHLLSALLALTLCDLSLQISLSSEFVCPTGAAGKFADPGDPLSYYNCSSGIARKRFCPVGESFDFNLHQCAPFGSNGECSGQANGALIPHALKNKFYKCFGDVAYQITCPTTLVFNPANNVCDWNKEPVDPVAVCAGTPDGAIPDNADPTKFYDCINGNEVPGDCPSGMSFDPTIKECAALNNIICSSLNTGDLVAHADENRFYKCAHGVAYQITCTAPLIFKCSICDWVWSERECNPISVQQNPCEGETTGRKVANSVDPKSYFLCNDGNSVAVTCPAGHSFDTHCQCCSVLRKVCADLPDNTMVQDPIDPQKFFVCVQNVGFQRTCPGNLVFDANIGVCKWPEGVVVVGVCNVK
uniref:chitinase n=1 Tax=Eptatretus burgeri TaxID=7764 RepID=A0A8C4QFE2_EPTBU